MHGGSAGPFRRSRMPGSGGWPWLGWVLALVVSEGTCRGAEQSHGRTFTNPNLLRFWQPGSQRSKVTRNGHSHLLACAGAVQGVCAGNIATRKVANCYLSFFRNPDNGHIEILNTTMPARWSGVVALQCKDSGTMLIEKHFHATDGIPVPPHINDAPVNQGKAVFEQNPAESPRGGMESEHRRRTCRHGLVSDSPNLSTTSAMKVALISLAGTLPTSSSNWRARARRSRPTFSDNVGNSS